MKSLEMSTFTYDQLFETILVISVCGIVLAALWIVGILISIEANKVAFYATPEHSLEMQEDGMETERTSKPTSPTSSSIKPKKTRRVRLSYKLTQLGSVSVLLLLTYLLLVVTDAPVWASALGSLSVFGIFLRYQIGDELRRQRIDRIVLMMSLFLLIASLMSVCTYAFKSLGNGEIYEGPARIVGYDRSGYNNTDHDPSTRTDLEVQWGKSWGCPLSGGKVCQAVVQGAMCTVNLEPTNEDGTRRRKGRRSRRRKRVLQSETIEVLENGEEESLNVTTVIEEEEENQDLAAENAELEKENEQLQKEVQELELANEETKEVAEEEVEEVKEEEEEDAATYDEDIEIMEEEELDIEEEYTDAYVEVEEEEVEIEEKYETDTEVIQEDEEKIEDLEAEETELDTIYEDYEGQYEENAEEYAEMAENAEAQQEEIQGEEDETKEEYSEAIEKVEEGEVTEAEGEFLQEEAEEAIEEATEVEGEEENDDDWYWEEITYEYDDDMFENEYWEYSWDSVWGDYACQDLFDEDASRLKYDTSVPAGTDDYPYINIYGSCKTCEAYILDYFAEEAFESVEEHRKMAIGYMTVAAAGFLFSFIMFVKYKVNPPAEHEIELLGNDGGVLA